MKFKFNGADYQIEFQREYKPVRVGYDPIKDEDLVQPSKYPYTTVKLWYQSEGMAKPELKRSATVGAHHTEDFTVERGRLAALRQITKTITKELKKAMWAAYTTRDAEARRERAEVKAKMRAIEVEALAARIAAKKVKAGVQP